jgi:hypothetical protein
MEETHVALKITNQEIDGVAVLTLDGRIVLGEETSALREKVKSLLGEGKKNILLNLGNVTAAVQLGIEIQRIAADYQTLHRLRGLRHRR